MFRALHALGHCLLNNPVGVELALGLDVRALLDSFATFNDGRVIQLTLEVKQLCHC